jgi:transcriptional regulator with XRE-family HTH domain
MALKLDKKDIKLQHQIALRLAEIREATGTNKAQFAYELGLDKQAISRVESGNGTSLYMIRRYCSFTGTSLKKFFDSPLFDDVL